jgi:hypothetical protein
LGDAADESVDLLAESVEVADVSVDLLAESESCEPLDSEEEANYSASTYWSGSNSTDRGSNSTERGSNTTESSIVTPRANLGYLVSNGICRLTNWKQEPFSVPATYCDGIRRAPS